MLKCAASCKTAVGRRIECSPGARCGSDYSSQLRALRTPGSCGQLPCLFPCPIHQRIELPVHLHAAQTEDSFVHADRSVIPGAMPPLIGWAAANGRLSYESWVLYFILFLWQFPHFTAIAWMHRDDYDHAGYVVLPRGESRFRIVTLQCILPLLALFPISFLAPTLGRACGAFFLPVGALNAQFVFCSSRDAVQPASSHQHLCTPAAGRIHHLSSIAI